MKERFIQRPEAWAADARALAQELYALAARVRAASDVVMAVTRTEPDASGRAWAVKAWERANLAANATLAAAQEMDMARANAEDEAWRRGNKEKKP